MPDWTESSPSTFLDSGLTSEEAQRKLAEYGPNEVPEKKINPLLHFTKKFWGLTPWMLEFTVARAQPLPITSSPVELFVAIACAAWCCRNVWVDEDASCTLQVEQPSSDINRWLAL